MEQTDFQAPPGRNFYCLYIKTGAEWDFVKKMQPALDSPGAACGGKLYCLGKQMRLKNGKEYTATIFPGYVFWETESLEGLSFFQKDKNFIKILPQNSEPLALTDADVALIRSFLRYGTLMPVIHVAFDVNDRIQVLDGLFKGQEGRIRAVNRRNKRVNFEVEFMNGTRVIGLTYEVVRKLENG